MLSYNELTDHQLSDLLIKGDETAFIQIFKRYNSILYIHAFKKLKNKEEAKDIVQETFAVLWAKRNSIVFNTNLSGYLYVSIRNRIFDYLSHQEVESKYMVSLQDFLDREDTAVTDHLIREKQITEIIEREIASLPPRMRLVFELSRKKHLSHKEIAEELGISEQTVTDQVKKALKILRVKVGLMIYITFLL